MKRILVDVGIDLVPVSLELASRSARYRSGLNLATVDSIIFTAFLESQCDLILTVDADIAQEQVRKLVQVELLA